MPAPVPAAVVVGSRSGSPASPTRTATHRPTAGRVPAAEPTLMRVTTPTWVRKALHARDRGCRWPGCQAPTAWCDAHHLTWWVHDGQTAVDDMILTCRWHHTRVHEGGWSIRLDPTTGDVHVTRPDGRP